MFTSSNQRIFHVFLRVYLIIHFFISHGTTVPLPIPIAVHETAQGTHAPSEMIEVWKRTLDNSIPKTLPNSESYHAVNAMRSGPLAAVFRATLSTDASIPCTAKDPRKCEVALNGFGTFGETHYTFEHTVKNLQGRSTQVLISCRCLTKNCSSAILVRPIEVLRQDQNGKLDPSRKRVCLYEAVKGKFSDCHREVFRVSYRDRNYGKNLVLDDDNKNEVNYAVSDEHHGDFWTARGHRESKRGCNDTEIEKLPRVSLSKLSERDTDGSHNITSSERSPCDPPAGVQYFLGNDENEDEICGEIFDTALASAVQIASQQDCYGIGKRENAFLEPRSAILITDTELALTCSSAVLGILMLWSVFWKHLRREQSATRFLVLAVFLQIGLSYVLEALPLHSALQNEIEGREWRSLIAFVDATLSHTFRETEVGGILILTIVLGEVQYLTTRVGLVAALTGIFDFVGVALGLLILVRMSGCLLGRTQNDVEGESPATPIPITVPPEIGIQPRFRRQSFLRKSRSFSSWETSSTSNRTLD